MLPYIAYMDPMETIILQFWSGSDYTMANDTTLTTTMIRDFRGDHWLLI